MQVGSKIKRLLVRVTASSCIALITYIAACLVMLILGALSLRYGHVSRSGIFHEYQYAYFHSTHFSELLTNYGTCVVPDRHVLYKSRIGECRFKSYEFDTRMHFTEQGRWSGEKSERTGIAAVGDSHTMGWGVNDEETFSALLENIIDRPVYNLGVASYGTYQELLSLERSGILSRIDTIIIQYCQNDIYPNLKFLENPRFYAEQAMTDQKPKSIWSYVLVKTHPTRTMIGYALSIPILEISAALKGSSEFPIVWSRKYEKPLMFDGAIGGQLDFSKHHSAISTLFTEFPWLNSKRVIVFYSNSFGWKFFNFEQAASSSTGHVEFVELDVEPRLYFPMDNHPTKEAHRDIAWKLSRLLLSPASSHH